MPRVFCALLTILGGSADSIVFVHFIPPVCQEVYAPSRFKCSCNASLRISCVVHRSFARRVQSRTYVFSSTFSVRATGFASSVDAFLDGFDLAGVDALLVAILDASSRTVYTYIRRYVGM